VGNQRRRGRGGEVRRCRSARRERQPDGLRTDKFRPLAESPAKRGAFVYRGGNAQGVRGNRMGTPGHVQEAKDCRQGFAHASAACRLVRTAGRNYRRHHLLCKRQGAARPTPGIPPGATRLTELANGSGVLESQRCPPARTGALACRLSASGRSARSTKASPSCPARRREALGPRRASGRRTSGIACGATTGRRVEEMESSGYGTQSAASRVRA
jgi:hypothetical protein